MAASSSSISGFHFQVATATPYRADHQKKPVTHRQTPAKLEEPDSPTMEVDDVKDPVHGKKDKPLAKHKSKLMMALGGHSGNKKKKLNKSVLSKLQEHADHHSEKHCEKSRHQGQFKRRRKTLQNHVSDRQCTAVGITKIKL